MVALAAARHGVPVVVLTGLYKLAPLFPHDEDELNDLRSPAEVLDFDAIEASLPPNGVGVGPDLHVAAPALSYVRPDLVSLLVTNEGSYTPAYVYRLLSDHFSPEDYELK